MWNECGKYFFEKQLGEIEQEVAHPINCRRLATGIQALASQSGHHCAKFSKVW